jgi:hypothetical protein
MFAPTCHFRALHYRILPRDCKVKNNNNLGIIDMLSEGAAVGAVNGNWSCHIRYSAFVVSGSLWKS